jgi:esterase/lipase
MGSITIEASGRLLAADLFSASSGQADGPVPGVLFVHGLRSDRSGYRERAESVAAAIGGVSLTFDLSGHGERTADFDRLTRRDHLTDVIAAYEKLISAGGVAPDRIGVCGASYGGYLSALLVGQRAVRRLLLRAPALYDDQSFDVPLGDVVRSSATARADLVADSLRQFRGKTLVLESGEDEVVPHETIATYLRLSSPAEHEVIVDATHALTEPAWREHFLRTIISFFGPLSASA